ncbi:MAG: transglutaminase domain-containing protein [Deltaproteobacteria bacterium]|uniref:Transglutaminase domain-containing protein n=1 Tax=Candidatus Zymogenus saltonus TaxID=2844893 RepID=A0A9D8PNJ3_9DELT|nr:transglutaminase domain-containing protein [Candidatus Zymogenus saltonus]
MRKRNFLLLIILACCLSLIYTNSFAAERAWEELNDSEVSIGREGNVVTVSGRLEGKGDSDTVYLLSDSKIFSIDFEYPPPGTDFWAELFWGNGSTTNIKYQLNSIKYITPGYLGGMYLKIYSKRGSGGWSFRYAEKDKRLIDFTWTITIGNKSKNVTATKVEVKVPIFKTFEKYQEVLESSTNIAYRDIGTDNLGNNYYVFEILNLRPNSSVEIAMNYKIMLKADYPDPMVCEGGKISGFLNPEPLIESNHPYIINLAREIVKDDITDCEKAESIYRYALQNISYEFQTPMVGALKALKSGKGDCNEFTDAIIALSRASGIPARKGNGFAYFEENHLESHAFPEVYLPGLGWSVADPTLCCFVKRPPIYLYNYVGENPSLFKHPDWEEYTYNWWFDGDIEPNIWDEYKVEGRELE